jgi:hypothetical protein
LEHDTAGDPITGLKWTRKTPQKIAELLEQVDIPVSANTVARLLHNMNYSLRANHKKLVTGTSPSATNSSNTSPRYAIASSVAVFP